MNCISIFVNLDPFRKWLLEVYKAYLSNLNTIKNPSKERKKLTVEFYLNLLFHQLNYNSEWQNEVLFFTRDQNRKRKTLLRYTNYKENGFFVPNLSYKLLLDSIKPNSILLLVKLLLLEKKILLVRSNYADNAIIIECLLSLLYPLYYVML